MPNRLQRRAAEKIKRQTNKAAAKQKSIAARTRPPAIAGKLRFTAPVQIAAADAGQPNAPRTFTLTAYTGEPMNIFPFDLPVVVDLATLDLSAQRLPVLYDHCPAEEFLVGQTDAVKVEGGQLMAAGRFTLTADPKSYGRRVLERADAGYVWQASIGGNPAKVDEVKAGESVTVNGRDYPGPVYVARGVSLREISFVVLGGDRRTSAVVARHNRAKIKGAAMSFEEWLLSMGFENPGDLSEVQKANLQQVYNAEHPEGGEGDPADPPTNAEGGPPEEEEETPPANARGRRPAIQARRTPPQVPDVAAELRRQAAAELRRQADVRRICAAANNPTIEVTENGQARRVELLAHATEHGWDATRTELEALRSARAQAPAVISRSHDRDCTLQALQGSMILRARRGRLDHPAFTSRQAVAMRLPEWLRAGLNTDQRQRAMEAAHRYSSLSAVDLCREACRLAGVDAPHDREDMIRAAFSSSALTNIFTTSVNAVLLAGYMEAIDTTQGWTTETEVNDFKTNERPRVLMGPGLKKLPRGGEADHANYSDVAESYKIHRFARQFQVDDQDMIDDNLSVFEDTPTRFGEAAARLRPDLVYSIILDNPTLSATARDLFNSTDGNLNTTAALSAVELRTAIAMMRLFRENGVNLNLMPTHLIVPPSLEELAIELSKSPQLLISYGADDETLKERGNINTLQRYGLTVVSDARLENGVTDPLTEVVQSGSATTWYIASNQAHTIEIGYLKGTGRAPQVRTAMLDKGKYGINWDVKMDIGAKALDWKGFVQNTA